MEASNEIDTDLFILTTFDPSVKLSKARKNSWFISLRPLQSAKMPSRTAPRSSLSEESIGGLRAVVHVDLLVDAHDVSLVVLQSARHLLLDLFVEYKAIRKPTQ